MRSSRKRERKQAWIITVTSITPFLLNLISDVVLPAFGINILTQLGHIYTLIMIFGIYYSIFKYRLFEIEPNLLVKELLQEMMDLVILASAEGKIIRINNYTEKLLDYPCNELINRNLSTIMPMDVINEVFSNRKNEILRFPEVYCIKKDGSHIPVSLSCSTIIDPYIKDILGLVFVGQDIRVVKQLEKEISEHKKAREHITFLAYHDSLTGLPNRKYFYEMLNYAIENPESLTNQFIVLFLDMDDLKLINDKYGHEVGDLALSEVGRRCESSISEKDIVARIGGDEFTFMIFGINDYKAAQLVADRILYSVNQPFEINGELIGINASIGISMFPGDGDNANQLLKKADNEMYIAKRKKKSLMFL